MITLRCGRCTETIRADDSAARRGVTCQRCGHVNVCPDQSTIAGLAPGPRRSGAGYPVGQALLGAFAALALAGSGWLAWSELDSSTTSAAPAPTSAEAVQEELLRSNIGQPGDVNLDARYREVATQYFGGKLPTIAVRWEAGLAQVGAVADQHFTLEGMFGHVGKRMAILLNPEMKNNPAALTRALCHEMVHAYLFVNGDTTTNHGPAFQAVLKRLSDEGAFEGILATDEERSNLRAWLDAESARLDEERKDMDKLGDEIEHEHREVEEALADFNARVSNAGAPGVAAPSGDERAALDARREAYNQRALEANARSQADQADLEHFNSEVARYNLMLVYPDGLDERQLVKPKVAAAVKTGGL